MSDARGWLVAPALLVVGVLFAYPVSRLLLLSVTEPAPGLQNFRKLIESPVYLKALWNTIVISGSVTLLCVFLGYPIAYSMAHAGQRLRRLLIFVVLIPFWSSILVRTFAWMVLLQKRGLINTILVEYLGPPRDTADAYLQSHRRADRHEPYPASVHDPPSLLGPEPHRAKPQPGCCKPRCARRSEISCASICPSACRACSPEVSSFS